METMEVLPRLHLLRIDVGQAYLWRDTDGVTLIDAGPVGSGPAIGAALRSTGTRPRDLRRVVLTHFHEDHAGGAAEIAATGDVEVYAHRLDAAVIRGETAGAPPVLDDAPDWERALFANKPKLPDAPPVRVDHEVEDGDTLPFGDGARVIAAPGHTHGSIAVHLPRHGVLFVGDAAANVAGRTMLGVFNTDRATATASLRTLSRLDTDVACFGHGEPIVAEAGVALRRAAAGQREG